MRVGDMQAQPQAQDAAAPAADQIAAAHAAMLHDQQLQFRFSEYTAPQTPDWVRPVGEVLRAIAPLLQYVFWGGVIVIVLVIGYALFSEIRRRMPARAKQPKAAPPPAPDYRP